MFFLATAFAHLFATVPGPVPVGAPPEPRVTVQSGVVFDGMLVCLNSDGTVGAWELKTEKYAKDAATRFARKGLLHLAADDKKLWAADEKTVYLWSARKREWEKHTDFDAGNETLLALTPARGRPFLVFHSKVIEPTREKDGTFKFPKDLGALPGSRLSISATHGTDKMLWLGTDYGEWGGTLIGFDPETGKWIKSRVRNGVTSITEGGVDEVVVSWYTAHLGVRATGIQVFKPDATEKRDHPTLKDHCYYGLAYNRHDKTLTGMERQELVAIKDGKPTKIAEVEFGAVSLIPLGPKSLAVIAYQGAPYLLRDGKLVRLPGP
jgi:hypothetical protein